MIRLYIIDVNSVYIGNPEIFQRIVNLIFFFKSFNMYSDCETNIGKMFPIVFSPQCVNTFFSMMTSSN